MRQRIVATVGAIFTIGLFLLTNAKRLADLISLVHLPHDVEELLTSMSQTPTLISYGALATGLACLTYLVASHWWPKAQPSGAPTLATAFVPQERPALDPTKRDVTLADAIWRAFEGEWGKRAPLEGISDKDSASPETLRFYSVTSEVRQRAFDGSLPIWAKRRPRSSLYEPVPKEFWGNHDIAASYSMRGPLDVFVYVTRALAIGETVQARTNVWEGFMTSREAVERLWPASQREGPVS